MFARQNLILALLFLVAGNPFARPAGSQTLTSQPLTVDGVLARVRANAEAYRASIPNFICDESVDSFRTSGGKVKDEMKVQSSFSLVRSSNGKDPKETRVQNLVNGKKPKSQKFAPPYFFVGGYANVIGFVNDKCSSFVFAPDALPDGKGPIVLLTEPKPDSPDLPAYCSRERKLQARTKAVIDPKSFQVVHLEQTLQDVSFGLASHLPFVPAPSTHNVFFWSVDFAPISLGDKSFWLPQTVTSSVKDKNKPLTLEYVAHYSHYHRFAATITILPGAQEVSQP